MRKSLFPRQQGQKHFDHYAEALIYHCSNVSCITDFLLAIIAFLLYRLSVFMSRPNQKRNQISSEAQLCTSVRRQHSFHLPIRFRVLFHVRFGLVRLLRRRQSHEYCKMYTVHMLSCHPRPSITCT